MKGNPFPSLNRALMLICFCFATVFLATLSFGQAQSTGADLTGSVVDPNGAVINGAIVTAKDVSGGVNRTTTSAADGTYKFIGLPPGVYEIGAEAANFKKVLISPVRLTVGQSAELTIKLEIGASTAVVTVSGDEVQL